MPGLLIALRHQTNVGHVIRQLQYVTACERCKDRDKDVPNETEIEFLVSRVVQLDFLNRTTIDSWVDSI